MIKLKLTKDNTECLHKLLFYTLSRRNGPSFKITRNCSQFPTEAFVVIAGAGVVANSVAYHLSQNGWRDVLVLEQNKIGSGTSHFGSGTLGMLKPIAHRNLIKYSIKLYEEILQKGFKIDLKKCGSINLAQTKDRLISLRRQVAVNLPTGVYCELISKEEINRLHPYIHTDDIEGAVWVPEDSVANPQAICQALAILSQRNGVRYIENCFVKQVLTNNSKVYAVSTDRGTVKCDYFVNCAGMWARDLGLRCSPQVRIPSYPAEHFYAITGVLNETLNDKLPYIRDFDYNMYAREYNNRFMIGWFENKAKPAFEGKPIPRDWKNHLTEDLERFKPLWSSAVNRIPILKNILKPQLKNSPDNFTPDGTCIMGEVPEVTNYFVAVGMNANSLQGAGGIGRAVAEWIIEGEPTQEVLPFNVQRFLDVHNNRQYLQQRIKEVVGRHYSLLYPFQSEYQYGRRLRCSPLYSVLEKRGAVFGIKMAYERALYFDSTYVPGGPLPKMPDGSFYKPKFFDFMREEYLACREGVGIIDMSSFSKIEIKSESTEVVNYLQLLCSNEVDIPVGSIVHTGMQNERGGYENDCMLVRSAENSYFMVSPTSQQTRVYEWMTKFLPQDSSVDVNDVTSMYTVINVVGPKATKLLQELSNSDVKLAPFVYKKLNIGYASDVMVMSFTHTGEPGYCLHIPSEYALHVYYKLMKVGKDYGARDVGTLTQRFMRIEKFIPFWAEELTSFVTPYEAGNAFNVKLNKSSYFIGKEALRRQKQEGIKKRLVLFHLQNIDADKNLWPWGGEPIYRNNEFVGTITSSGYGFSADKLICFGFIERPKSSPEKIITSEYIMSKDACYTIDIAGNHFQMVPHIHPPVVNNVINHDAQYKPTLAQNKPTLVQSSIEL